MGGMLIKIKETKNYELWLYENSSYENLRYQFRLRNKSDKNNEHEISIPDYMIGMDYEDEKIQVDMLNKFFNEL